MVREKKRGLRCVAFSGDSPSCLHPICRCQAGGGACWAGNSNLYPSLAYSALLLFETSLSKEETLYCVGLGSVGECVEHSRGYVED